MGRLRFHYLSIFIFLGIVFSLQARSVRFGAIQLNTARMRGALRARARARKACQATKRARVRFDIKDAVD